ncbi:MAG: uridine kinase [Candidatus Gastranaerophilaceae bacterium]
MIYPLLTKELSTKDKLFKPDLSQKSGRELLAFYIQTKLKQLFAFDKKCQNPMIIEVRPDFISNFTKRLINNPDKRLLIGINGASASGKSTICSEIQRITQDLEMPVSILSTDNYFKDISNLILKYGSFDNLRDSGYDIDSPEGFQLDVLYDDLENLSVGNNIKSPKYLPNGTGVSVPNSIPVKAEKVIIIEGTATFYGNIKDIFDVKLYIEVNDEIRRQRFLQRAETERNQDLENAKKHWNYLICAGEKYIMPTRKDADIIINGNADLNYLAQIIEYLHIITNSFETEKSDIS